MKKIKLLISIALLSLLFINVIPAYASTGEVYASHATEPNNVYTLSETVYDEETGKLAYQKVTYSKNTYTTTLCTQLDASGNSIEVSNDAQYVYIPARYNGLTESTQLSIKYVNSGVERIYLHAEYYAGISQGGVDYNGGCKFVCVNALSGEDAWNVSNSKSVDGYDVATILFGNYAKEIYDFSLIGFRLYFDYGLTVDSERSFEIYGYEVHESSKIPSFTTDPKATRVSKLTSDDVTIKNNTFTVESSATVSAKIYDYTTDNYRLSVNFTLSDKANIDFKLDGETVESKLYGKGTHTVYLELVKEEYNKLDMEFTATNVEVKIKNIEFLAPASVDMFTGSGFDVSQDDNDIVVKYTYKNGWNSLKASIRNYNKDYEYLRLNFTLSHPIVVGVYVDDVAVRSHWSYKDPLEVGQHELLIDLSVVDIDSTSVLMIYLDPSIDATTGVDAEKTVVFHSVDLLTANDLPKANITVDSLFEFEYDGSAHDVSGVETDSLLPLIYEYKLEGATDDTYTEEKPVNAGVYTVRITSPFNITEDRVYGKTYAYSKIIIEKTHVDKPTVDDINIDYANNTLYYDSKVFVVALDENYTQIIKNGSYIQHGMKLYFKHIDSNNYYESETTMVELNSKGEMFEVTVNYLEEATNESIPTAVEYSTDGLNWTSGNDEPVKLEAEMIYIFRTKATDSSFASDKTYLATPTRPGMNIQVELAKTDYKSFTLKEIENAEYRLANGEWQDSPTFTGFAIKDLVEVFVRIKSTETTYASLEVSVIVKIGYGIQNSKSINTLPTQSKLQEQSTVSLYSDELDANTFIVTNYNELSNAVKNLSSNYLTTIIVKGSVVLEYDVTLKGKVKLIGEDNAELIFEKGSSKRRIYNSKNSEITIENIKLTRTVTDNTENFPINLNEAGSIWFVNVEFNVAVPETGANLSYDRITYVPNGPDVRLYFDNCVFNTEAYFYRGTMVFYNSNKDLPQTGGSPTIYDLRNFKIDYNTKTFIIPSKVKVSLDEEFTDLISSGSQFESNTTYYITNGSITFTYTTKNLKLQTPTLRSVNVDYANEIITFDSKYLVSKNAEFTDLVSSGDSIAPGMKLFIKEIATGIYMDSDVYEVTLPERPEVVELASEFECTFGFAMEYYPNAEYVINGEYQYSPVFIGLESGKTYTVTIRIAATDNSFASNTYQVVVTTK